MSEATSGDDGGERVRLLRRRLDELAASLAATGRALALLALGSAAEPEVGGGRLDAFSDLDFFAIARPGEKRALLDSPAWLWAPRPLSFCFRNTVDGWKALSDDEVLYEMAVFEPHELAAIPFCPGRVVWAAPDFDPASVVPRLPPLRPPPDRAWVLGELLTCLYVGLCRARRGEALAAMRMIQVHALGHLLSLLDAPAGATKAAASDRFDWARRIERRLPGLDLAPLAQGYGKSVDSARAQLSLLEQRLPGAVDPALGRALDRLLGASGC